MTRRHAPRLPRAGRRTNLGLLVLLSVAFATGVGAFAVGTLGPAVAVTLTHGAAGLAVVLLVPWKQVIARRSLRRARARSRRQGGWAVRSAGLVLAGLLTLCVASGVLHVLGGFRTYLGLTPMQVHVGAALVAVPLLLQHVLTHRQRPQRADLSRRSLLRGGALTGGGVALWGIAEGVAAAGGLAGSTRRATGSHAAGSGDPARMPVTQWMFDPVPEIDAARWRLRLISPYVVRDVDYPELADGRDTVTATLDCTGGWCARQRWRGVRLDRLLGPADDPDLRGDLTARSIEVVSVTGYRRTFPARDAAHLLLATQVGGAPLLAGHGAPVRLVAPGRRGFWWVKWVDRVEVVDRPWWLQAPFPTQ